MSAASDQITEYLSVGGLFNPEMMNQTQHEAVRDTLIKARDDIQRLERYNAALREQVEELDAKWKMAEDQCFDQVGKIGELERENAALRAERDAARKLLDTHVLRSDLFGYLAWLEDHRDHGDIDLKRADYLILVSDGTTCWGKTFMEAVQVAEQHDRELFDAAMKEEQP